MIKFLNYIPFQLTFFLIVGILIGTYLNIQPILLVIIGLVLVFFLILFYALENKRDQPSFLFSSIFFLFSIFIGISAVNFKNSNNNQYHYINSTLFIEKQPLLVSVRIDKVLKPNINNIKYEASLLQIKNTQVDGKILVNIQQDSIKKELKVDDVFVVKTNFETIKPPLNPYAFNYKVFLKKRQIQHQIYIKWNEILVTSKNKRTLKGLAATFRLHINSALQNNGFKDDEFAVINALLLGQRNGINSDLLGRYAAAGAIHILAVSGLHVGLLLVLLTFLFKPIHYFKNGKTIAAILIISLLWIYALIAGMSASVIRAVTMFTALTIGMKLVHRSNVYNTLVISIFFLLLFNPFYLFEVGFQLSYLAVFFIVWIQPKIYNLWKSKYWLIDKMWQLFTVSLAAQIGVLPLSMYYFHQFPGLFFISNLVIIPFLGFILSFGIIVILLALLGILPNFLAEAYTFIIQQMNGFVAWVSNQEAFLIQDISFSFQLMLVLYVVIFATFKWIEKKIFYRFIIVLLSIILFQGVIIFEKYSTQSINKLIVFNKNRTSMIAINNGGYLKLYVSDSLNKNDYALKSYVIGSGAKDGYSYLRSNVFKFKNDIFLVVDSLGLYNIKSIKPTIVILQQSPKINLDRMLVEIKPRLIIADASNYKSDIEKWKQTCIKSKTPFHSTMQKGAFIIN